MERGNVPGDLSRYMRLCRARHLSALLQSRRIGEAVTIDNDALYVSHSYTENGRVVASLGEAARWLEEIEDAGALHLAAA